MNYGKFTNWLTDWDSMLKKAENINNEIENVKNERKFEQINENQN